MKRVILCIGWLTIFNFTGNFIGGFVMGFINGMNNASASGAQVGLSFTQQYGWIVAIAAALIAIIGTATGKLPYTKKDA
ncbi:MAG: hypothetical protein P9L90_04710 [Candidatus Aadella gelida]|nr:hypothetical protein [Candidatus Aadella gelida]